MNAWQKCPVCDGIGQRIGVFTNSLGNTTTIDPLCHTCKGTGIIHQDTGLPPLFRVDKELLAPHPIKSDE